MIVVDASVAAKWFLPELDSSEAERLLEGPETMTAPDLIPIEVAAAISRRFRLGDLDAAEAGELCEKWLKATGEGVVSTVPSALDIADAVRLSLAFATHPRTAFIWRWQCAWMPWRPRIPHSPRGRVPHIMPFASWRKVSESRPSPCRFRVEENRLRPIGADAGSKRPRPATWASRRCLGD